MPFSESKLEAPERKGSLAQIVRITGNDEERAGKIFVKSGDKTLSFTDCTSFALMDRLKLETALSLDRDFQRMGFRQLPAT